MLSRFPSSIGNMAALSPVKTKMLLPSLHAAKDDQGTKLDPPLANVDRMPSLPNETVPDLALKATAAFSKRAFQRNQDNQMKNAPKANTPAIGPQRTFSWLRRALIATPNTNRQRTVEYQLAAKKRSQKRLGRNMRAASFISVGVSVARICTSFLLWLSWPSLNERILKQEPSSITFPFNRLRKQISTTGLMSSPELLKAGPRGFKDLGLSPAGGHLAKASGNGISWRVARRPVG
jgi:hypothetical protein